MDDINAPVFVTEEEYLNNPRYEHCEYVDGQVVPLWMIMDEEGNLPDPDLFAKEVES